MMYQGAKPLEYRLSALESGRQTKEVPYGPIPAFTVANLPSSSDWIRCLVYVSDETGGATIAFSDGSDWRRVQDRAVVS